MNLYQGLESLLTSIYTWVISVASSYGLSPSILNFIDSLFYFFLPIIIYIIQAIIILAITLLNVIMLIWVERKFIARLMDRRGPMIAGYAGLLQNIADGIKLFLKEDIIPKKADKKVFLLGPIILLGSSFLILVALPLSDRFYVGTMDIGIVFIFAIFSLGPFAIFIAGWGANNKYTLIGGMRSAAQLISYEIPLIFSMIAIVILVGSFSLIDIVNKQEHYIFIILQPIAFVVFITAILAEVERIPFDLPEAEAELVEGWTTEYGGIKFGLILFTEYIRGYIGCALITILFLGGWRTPIFDYFFGSSFLSLIPELVFLAKVYLVFMLFVWIRAALPRVRIDQLLNIGWKRMLPLALIGILLSIILLSIGAVVR